MLTGPPPKFHGTRDNLGLDHDVDLTTGPEGPDPDALTPNVAQFLAPPIDGG
jgi:hypothetical protein